MPTCVSCGNDFEAKRADAKYCGPTCRKRASRGQADEVAALKARADQLSAQQKAQRGTRTFTGLDGKPTQVPGPYVPSYENESRAREILGLRRKAARLEHPLT